MNIILFAEKADPDRDRASSPEILESVQPHQHETNITDGGEFMDDAIRMNEQPFGKTAVNEDE